MSLDIDTHYCIIVFEDFVSLAGGYVYVQSLIRHFLIIYSFKQDHSFIETVCLI